MVRIRGMYRCKECGRLFYEDEVMVVEESRGEFWGFPCTEKMHYSPCCMGDYDDAYEDEEDEELIDE